MLEIFYVTGNWKISEYIYALCSSEISFESTIWN